MPIMRHKISFGLENDIHKYYKIGGMEEEKEEEREPRELTQDEINEIFNSEVDKIIEWSIAKSKYVPNWYIQVPISYDERGHVVKGEPNDQYVERVKRVVFDYAMSHVKQNDSRFEEHKDFVDTEWVAPPTWGKRIMKYVNRMLGTLPESKQQKLRGEIREVVIGHCINFIITRYGVHPESAYPLFFSFNKLNGLTKLKSLPEFDTKTKDFLEAYGIDLELSNIEAKLAQLVRLNLVRLFSEDTKRGIIVRVNRLDDVPEESFLHKYEHVLGDSDDSQEPDSQMSTVSYKSHTVDGVNSFLAGIGRNSVSAADDVVESPFLGNNAKYELMPEIDDEFKKLYPKRQKKSRSESPPSVLDIDNIPFFMVLARGIGDETDPMSHSMLGIRFRRKFHPIDIVYGKDLGRGDGTREAVLVFNGRYLNDQLYNTVQNVGVLTVEAVYALNALLAATTKTTMEVFNDTVTWKGVLDVSDYVYHTTPPPIRTGPLTKDGPIRIGDEPEQVNCASLIIMCGLGSLKKDSPYPWPQSIIECSLAKLFEFAELYTYNSGDEEESIVVAKLLSLGGGKRTTRKRKTYKKRCKSKAKFSRKSR
jgi:hypothetical protein